MEIPENRTFKGVVVPIAELARLHGTLKELVFDGCHIVGPAVIASLGTTQWRNNTFPAREIFWQVEPDQVLVGVVVVENCLIERCTFDRVSIVGPPDFIARFLNDSTD